VSGITPQLAAG